MSSFSRALQWKIVLLIIFITTVNYFDRSSISFAILPLESELGIDNQDFGLIASGFGIGYFLISCFAGLFVDKFGAIKIWGIAAVLWSIVTFLMGFGKEFWVLFSLRVLLGMAEAIHFPAMLKVVTEWLDPHWRSRCLALGLLGVPLASVIGAPALSYIIETFSWQMMFFILGILGVVWAILWSVFFIKKSPPKAHYKAGSENLLQTSIEIKKQLPWSAFFLSRPFLGNCLNFFIFGYSVFFALMWFPGYLEQTFHVDILTTGKLVIFPWLTGALLLVLGGWASDKLWKKTGSIRISRIFPVGVGMFLSGLCFFIMIFAKTLPMNIFLFSLGMGFAFFCNAPYFSLNADLFKNRAGTAQGIMASFFALSGIVSPALTGWFAKSTGNFKGAIFLVALLSFLSSLIAFGWQKFPRHQNHY